MKFTCRAAALLALTAVAGAASAQQDVIATVQNPWEGWFVGANIGGAWNHTCSSWEPGPTITGNPAFANAFYNRNCPNNGNFIGGIDGGYNFQIDQWVWGFKADYEAVGSSSKSSFIYFCWLTCHTTRHLYRLRQDQPERYRPHRSTGRLRGR